VDGRLLGLGIIKLQGFSVVWQRLNNLRAVLNSHCFGALVSIFVQTKAFTTLITISILPFSKPALGLLMITNSSHSRCIIFLLYALVYILDPPVNKPKIAFTVIQTISVNMVHCDLSWNVSHYEVMEKLWISTAASPSNCIPI